MFSVIFGAASHSWMWLVGAAAFMVGGLITSEVFFGNATVDDVQPFIGGLAVDESVLGGLLLGVPVVLVSRYVVRHYRPGPSTAF
jgi:hypothetical protein